MKSVYLSLSFDDGRKDNVNLVLPILEKYGFRATFFITTGFVDGTFKSDEFGQNREALSVSDCTFLAKKGMEIALHGDRHITEDKDLRVSYEKVKKWGLSNEEKIGFSVPHCQGSDEEIKNFVQRNRDILAYLRDGRDPRCYHFFKEADYGLFHLFHNDKRFDDFNSLNLMRNPNPWHLYTIMVKDDFTVGAFRYFLEKHAGEDTYLILTFHSIVTHPKDTWEWSAQDFDALCAFLSVEKRIRVLPIKDWVGKFLKA